MGYEDTITKQYFSRNEIFADAFNYLVYGGEQRISPNDLREMDTAELVLPFGTDYVKAPTQKYRDVLKALSMHAVGMSDAKAAYLLLGIEEQTNVHYAMPVKDMLYDAMNYAGQVDKACRSYRENQSDREKTSDRKNPSDRKKTNLEKLKLTRGEFLSGFRKDDKLLPVITLVVYMGAEEWDAPTSIYEMLTVQDDEILRLVPDYHINLIAPAEMNEEEFDKFHTGLGAALQCIKHSKDESMQAVIQKSEKFKRIDRSSADLINEMTKSGFEYEEEGGYVDMCIAVENDRRRAREEGLAAGRKKGREEGRARTNLLNRILLETGRIDDLQRAITDNAYQEQLMRELLPVERSITES